MINKVILNEGGNVEIDGIAAQRLDLNKVSRSKVVAEIDTALKLINAAFNKMYKVPLWSPKLIKNKEFLSGSAFHFFNVQIPDDQFTKVKSSVGDIDTMVDKALGDKAQQFLTKSKGKQFGPAKLIGFKPNPGADTLISLWQFNDPPVAVQIDIELVDYKKGSPTDWSKFSHSSAWEDLSVGIKGVFHKYLMRSLTHKDAKDRYIQMKTKLKKVNASDLAFAVSGGVREKFSPVIDPKTKKPAIATDGLGIYKEIPASESEYVNDLPGMFSLLFDRKPTKQDIQSLNSFLGVLALINKYFSDEDKNKITMAFISLLFGPSAQQLYKGDPTTDKREKEIALNKMLAMLQVSISQSDLEKVKSNFYSKYKAESLTEADAPDYKRQGIKHIYNPGSTVEMKDVDFLAFVDQIGKNGGTLDNIPITLKVDGAGIRFGRDQSGKPFFMTSRVTTPMYADMVGTFAKYSKDNNGNEEQVARAAKYDAALDLIVNSDFIKVLPKDSIVQAEMMYNAMAEQTDKGLKFVNIPYDPKKLGKEMTLVPISASQYSTGQSLPDSDKIIKKVISKSNPKIKIVGTDLEHGSIDVSSIVNPIVKNMDALRTAISSKKKNDPAKEKAKTILSQARKSISDAIINNPNIKGKDKLGNIIEGLVIAMPNGQLAKVTSSEMKDVMAAKKAPTTGGNRHKAAVVTAGSFVGHIGHQKVVDTVIAAAKKLGGDPYVYISAKTGPDDPIPPEVKLATWKKLYPEYANIFHLIVSPDGNAPSPVKKIEKELVLPANSPYKKIVLMVGSDRYAGFKSWMDTLEKRMKDPKALAKYGGTQDQVSFDTIEIPRGVAKGGIDASFSALRNTLKDPNLSLQQKLHVWMQGFGNKLDADWVKKLMMLAAKGMGVDLSNREKTQEDAAKPKRDKYYINFDFLDGPVHISGHLLERLAQRTLSQKDMLDILFNAKKQYGQQIAELQNVDFVVKRKRDGLGYGIAKILMPDDTYKYVIKTAHDDKNIGKFQARFFVESDIPLNEEDDINVIIHDELNPKLFNSEGQMSPVVRQKLLDIAEDFKDFLGIQIPNLKDITISGSNAAYNYTPSSDIDLHLVVDLPNVDNDSIYRELFDAKKFQYNEQHDYKIKGFDVELYVQNANEDHVSNGIYSVMNDEWVQKPHHINADIDEANTRAKYDVLKTLILKALKANDYDLGVKLRKTLKKYRQVGLHSTGEFGAENLAWKALRSNGYIGKLYDMLNNLKDREFSLESHEQRLTEVDMSPSSLQNFANTDAAKQTKIGFEFEMIMPDVAGDGSDPEPDYDEDGYVSAYNLSSLKRDLNNFFRDTTTERQIERAVEDFSDTLNEYISSKFSEYVSDNPDEVRAYYKNATDLPSDEIETSIEDEDSTYDEVIEKMREDFERSFEDLDGALAEADLMNYSDWDNRYGFGWPHFTSGSDDEVDADKLSELADEVESLVDMKVKSSPNYHAFKTREPDTWYLETDSSIEADEGDGEGGLELISPPMPFNVALKNLDAITSWMRNRGAGTDSSTGFHMGVSIANMENVDYVKLILFLGDKFVLDEFGRLGNSYTRSALEKMQSQNAPYVMRNMPNIFDALKGGLDKAALKMIEAALVPKGEKYISVNIKGKYIEFRSAGGDYLNSMDKIKNTLLRYVRVINLAADPNEAKQEYAKKLYKLLMNAASKEDADSVKWFSMYASGNLTKEDLVRKIKSLQQVRQRKKNPAAPVSSATSGDEENVSAWEALDIHGDVVYIIPARNAEEAYLRADELSMRDGIRVYNIRPSTLESVGESQLNELANKPYSFKNVGTEHDGQVAKFMFTTEQEINYKVVLFPSGENDDLEEPEKVSVEFSAWNHHKASFTQYATGTGDAFRVFATVGTILKNYLQSKPSVTAFDMSADRDEPSRVKLYSAIAKMIPKFLPGWHFTGVEKGFTYNHYSFVKIHQLNSLKEYIAVSDKPFVWKKEEPKKELTEMQKACILGGQEYTGEIS